MPQAPFEPEEFFSSFLPSRFASAAPSYAGVTSVGSLAFRVDDRVWSYRLVDGALELTRDVEDDVVLQVSASAEDFASLLAAAAERRAASGSGIALPASSFRALRLDAETARLVRRVPGSVLFAARDGEQVRKLLVTPGLRQPKFSSPDCTIESNLEDWIQAEAGGAQAAMQLFVAGKLKITGNVQIAMALSSVLG
jgi:hypothetical protein